MRFAELEDKVGTIEVIAFPSQVDKYGELITVDSIVIVDGKTSFKDGEGIKLIADRIRPLTKVRKTVLYIKLTKNQFADAANVLNPILLKHSGDTPVKLCVEDKGKKNVYLADRSYWVEPSVQLTVELKNILGNDNVKLVE